VGRLKGSGEIEGKWGVFRRSEERFGRRFKKLRGKGMLVRRSGSRLFLNKTSEGCGVLRNARSKRSKDSGCSASKASA
jgi:hypothetical protein